MADNTHIEWTDATWNPVTGCSVTSPGCTNCYAMKLAGTRLAHHPSRKGLTTDTKAGPVWTGEVRLNEDWLTQPLKWKRPRRIFVCAHGDLFHENVPDEWIDRVFAVMALAPQHTFQVLTKRADRMRAYCQSRNSGGTSAIVAANALDNANWLSRELAVKSEPQFQNIWPLPNVWLGVSVEDQASADERIPYLLKTPAFRRFLSCEPLLGPVDLTRIMEDGAQECFHQTNNPHLSLDRRVWTETRSSLNCLTGHYWGEDLLDGQWEGWCGEHEQASPGIGQPGYYRPLDWIIVGGESGPGARPMHPDWARSLRDQCQSAGVSFFFKQWGEWVPMRDGGIASDRPITDRHGNVRDWMNRYVVADGDLWAGRVRGHSFTEHSTDLVYRVGKRRNGRLLDGREWNEVPA